VAVVIITSNNVVTVGSLAGNISDNRDNESVTVIIRSFAMTPGLVFQI